MSDPAQTVLRASYPPGRGRVFLRGDGAGLDWFNNRAPDEVDGSVSVFRLVPESFAPVQVKLVREDGAWSVGRNTVLVRGDERELRPSFDRTAGELSGLRTIELPWGGALHVRVRLPPSYHEQEGHHYPVLYCQDGQSIWSDGTDPFGVWGLDKLLDDLWDMGALDEIIVVSIDTGVGRLERLGPVPDPAHGGGQEGASHLRGMVEVLRPVIDAEYRTRREPEHNVVMGSSMGGLFSFWAAWSHPETFGGAICLSPSIWWGDRFALSLVDKGPPSLSPRLYIDCGNAASGFEDDAATRDGNPNTRSLYRALVEHGIESCFLNWPGHHHNAPSWISRLSTPLQMFFPRTT